MFKKLADTLNDLLQEGTVIPAHPLAIHRDLTINAERQKLLTRYYIDSGAGGVAVGVHTTQFAIRDSQIALYEPTLKLAAEAIDEAGLQRPFIKVAGICGPTDRALKEAEVAVRHGYHLGLLSMGGMQDFSEASLIDFAAEVAAVIPIFGFYLQPAVGGRLLSYEFWRDFVQIPNVYAIKVAAFDRYQTLDVVRAVCNSPRRNEIALYTGNDDNIVADLLTSYRLCETNPAFTKRFAGGLLGHWAVWTKRAVELLAGVKRCIADDYSGMEELLSTGVEVTDMNAAIFDARNSFHGCIPGIHEILFRQGIMQGTLCLDPAEQLSRGQAAEIDRVCKSYPYLVDDDFVQQFLKIHEVGHD